MSEYPAWICHDCGTKDGAFNKGFSTWHNGLCGWCGQIKAVTQPRDYGYPKEPK